MTEKRSLRQRIVHAGIWTIGGHASSQALRLLSNLLMTRLLMPEAFGIMAIATAFMLGLALFSDVGLGQSVVRSKRGHEAAFANTVWTLQAMRGGLICVLSMGLAFALHILAQRGFFSQDSVYVQPQLPWVLFALSLSTVVAGTESTKMAMANRALDVRKITQIELLSQIGALVLMVTWAFFAQSIWALVGGAIASAAIRTTLSHTLIPGPKNRFHWDTAAAREILGYGKWIFLSSILGFAVANGDKFILGGLVSASTLGMFSLATFLIGAIQQVFTKLGSSVAFPTFCEVARTNPENLRTAYYKMRLPVDIASLFAAGFLFAAGHVVANVLYDQRYKEVGYLLEILSISLLEIRYGLAGQCFMALGHSRLITILIGIRLPLVLFLLPAAYATYGIQGAAWITGGNVLITIPLVVFYKYKFSILDVQKELKTLPVLLIGLGTGLLTNIAFEYTNL